MTYLQERLDSGQITAKEIAGTIDHSLLQPTLTDEQMRGDLLAVRSFPLATVCIKPYAVPMAAELLAGTPIGVCTVIGFPHGSSLPDVKAFETERAFTEGAAEMDMVVNVGKVLSGDWRYVRDDIQAVLDVTRRRSGILKVIFENDYLPDDSVKIKLCEICSELKVDFVKTSTGYGFVKGADGRYSYDGATDHDLKLMRQHCAPEVQVKAAGGVRTLDDALRVLSLGVTRIGASATHAILEAAERRFGK
jgi:deoxyribose-phosphate aldolase